MAVLDGCTNLLSQTSSAVPINTSDVVEYDGPAFACVPLPGSPSTLNQVLKAIDDEVCNIKNNLLVDIDTSSITTYDGTPSFSCFTLTAGGPLNTIINEIGDQICSNTDRLDNFATSDVLTYDGSPTFACFTFPGSPTLNDVIDTLGNEICDNQTAISGKIDLTLLETYTKELRKDYVEAGGDTANIGPGITIDIENGAGGDSVYYVEGVRTEVATETLDDTGSTPARKRLTASSDNYLDFDTDQDYTVTAVPNGNPAPAVAGMRMWKIVTDGSSITGTTDLRNTMPIDGADICDATITDAKMVANTLTSASMSNIIGAGTTNVANVTVDTAGRVTALTTDFDISAPTNGDLIQFNSGSGNWENVTVASIGLTLPSGTAGQTLRSDGANWLANSIIYNNGTNVGIDTSTPSEKLTVAGNIAPEADATRDLGTASLGWANLYMSSNIHYTASLIFTRSSVDKAAFADDSFVFGGTSGDASALVEVQSTSQGFLPPKMTTAQKNAISTPAEGLIVYDTDLNAPFFFDGGSWVTIFAGSDGDWDIVSNDVKLDVTGNMLPNTDDSNDIGSSSLRWKDLYLGSTIDYDSNLVFKSGGTTRVTFENDGTVYLGAGTADASALLQIDSTTTGFLPPRMTTGQRDGISPAEGLVIYNTDNTDIEFYDGTTWQGTLSGNNGIYTGSGSLSGATVVTMATNNLQFDSTSTTGLFTIDATNDRIGIGIDTPSHILHVRDSITADVLFKLQQTSSAGTDSNAMSFANSIGSRWLMGISDMATLNFALKSVTNVDDIQGAGTEVFVADWTTFNTAIGRSSTLAGYRLVVRGENTTPSTWAAMFENSAGDTLVRIANDGDLETRTLMPLFANTHDIGSSAERYREVHSSRFKANGVTITSFNDAGSGRTPDYSSQIASTTNAIHEVWYQHSNSGTEFPEAAFAKARGTQASRTIVADDDITGKLKFAGFDGTAYIATAEIYSEVNGTPGSNDVPGDLIFATNGGAASVTERMRIDTIGAVHLNNSDSAPGGIANGVQVYAEDVSASSVLKIITEAADVISLYKVATGYSVASLTPDRSYDADSTTLDEIADVLGTLIEDLKLTGIITS